MILLDSNIIIYSALPEYAYLRVLIKQENSFTSIISKLEVLGFDKLDTRTKQYFEDVFYITNTLPITNSIIDNAILQRQQKKYSLADAIISSTAIEYNLELVTRNVSDFQHIEGLKIRNPIG